MSGPIISDLPPLTERLRAAAGEQPTAELAVLLQEAADVLDYLADLYVSATEEKED